MPCPKLMSAQPSISSWYLHRSTLQSKGDLSWLLGPTQHSSQIMADTTNLEHVFSILLSCLPVAEPMSMCNSGPPSASSRKSHPLVWASHREWQKRNMNLCLICEYVSSYVQLFFPAALLEHNCTSQTQPCLLTSSDFALWTLADQKYFNLLMSTLDIDSHPVSIDCTTAENTHTLARTVKMPLFDGVFYALYSATARIIKGWLFKVRPLSQQ